MLFRSDLQLVEQPFGVRLGSGGGGGLLCSQPGFGAAAQLDGAGGGVRFRSHGLVWADHWLRLTVAAPAGPALWIDLVDTLALPPAKHQVEIAGEFVCCSDGRRSGYPA